MLCNGIYQTNYIVLNVRAPQTTEILPERLAAGAKQCLLQIWSPATNIYESMASGRFRGETWISLIYMRFYRVHCLQLASTSMNVIVIKFSSINVVT